MTVLAPEECAPEKSIPVAGLRLVEPGEGDGAPRSNSPRSIIAPRRVRFETAVQRALTRIIEIVAAGTEPVSAVLWIDEDGDQDGSTEPSAADERAPIDFAAFVRARAAGGRRAKSGVRRPDPAARAEP